MSRTLALASSLAGLLLWSGAASVALGQEPADPRSTPQQEMPKQEVPKTAPEAEAAEADTPEDSDEAALDTPRKKVSDMTPEERREFRERRRKRLAAKEAEELADRVTFELSFPEDQGGGSAAGSAGDIEYKGEDFAVLSGGVDIQYQDVEISADQIDVNLATKEVAATGNVVLDQGPRRLTGTTLTFDLEEKTGKILQGSGYVEPDFYFSGDEIVKTGDKTFTVVNGTFTSCKGESPSWSFGMKRADIEIDGYAKVRGAKMKVKKAPVLYWPYVVWPVKEDRTSGFLVPNIGYSKRRGGYLGMAYYKTLGPSYDTTFYADLYTENYYGFGNEFRYRPTEGTEGVFEGYAIRDPETDEWRWKLNLDHETRDLPFGMRGVVTVREFSDFDFFRDFERGIDRNTVRSLESRGFASGNWGSHSLNILINKRETFQGTNTVKLERLPEVEYRLRPTQLGSLPLYLKAQSSAAFLGVERSAIQNGEYGRFDLFPELSLPLRIAPWLNFKVTGGQRFTWYGDSKEGSGDQPFVGESLTRSVPFATAEIIGPSFSRIFERQGGAIAKLKHVIEPRFNYTFLGDFDEGPFIPLFDEIDRVQSTNVGRVALVNRFLAKPRGKLDEEGNELPGGSAREILSLEFARRFSFDDDRPLLFGPGGSGTESSSGPLESLLRFNPSERTSLTARVIYDTLNSHVSSTSLSGTLGFGTSNALGLSWRTGKNALGETTSDQLRLSAGIDVLPKRLRIQGDVVYDLKESLLQQQRWLLRYTSQCYSWQLELRDVEFANGIGNPDFEDQDIRFSLTLKNVGTFLDLTN